MSDKSRKNSDLQIGKYQQGSGTEYHKEHASHVPDYGANIVDPNAKGVIKNIGSSNQ